MIEYTVKVHSNGSKYWYLNGQYHREDGPAIEGSNGDKYWYLNGTEYTEKEYNLKMNPVPVIKELSVSEISQLLGYEIKVVK